MTVVPSSVMVAVPTLALPTAVTLRGSSSTSASFVSTLMTSTVFAVIVTASSTATGASFTASTAMVMTAESSLSREPSLALKLNEAKSAPFPLSGGRYLRSPLTSSPLVTVWYGFRSLSSMVAPWNSSVPPEGSGSEVILRWLRRLSSTSE